MEKEEIKELILTVCNECNKTICNNCQCREYGDFCMPILLMFEKIEKNGRTE